jgi:hypothetical protein
MKMTIASIVVLIVAAALITAWLRARTRQKSVEIAPAHVLQKKYGLYADNRPTIKLDPAMVPENLRPLIPLAEKWGIGDDIIRGDVIKKSGASEKRELHDALYEPYEQVTAWLDSFQGKAMSDEAAASMYMQLALDEMGIFILEEKRKAKNSTQP